MQIEIAEHNFVEFAFYTFHLNIDVNLTTNTVAFEKPGDALRHPR